MSLMFYDGQIITTGTKKGKEYLSSHPGILASFEGHFLYGKHNNICYYCFSHVVLVLFYTGDLTERLAKLIQPLEERLAHPLE